MLMKIIYGIFGLVAVSGITFIFWKGNHFKDNLFFSMMSMVWLLGLLWIVERIIHLIRKHAVAIKGFFSRNKKIFIRSGIVVASLIVLGIGARFGWQIWEKKQPQRVEVTIDEPAPTSMHEGSTPHPVRIYFESSVAELKDVGNVVKEGITLEPQTNGDWKWISDKELVFHPNQDWLIGQTYRIALDKKIFPKHIRLSKYQSTFESAPFDVRSIDVEFYVDPKNPEIKRAVGTVRFSHAVDADSLKKHIVFDMKKKHYDYTVTFDKLKGTAYFQTEALPVPAKSTNMILKIKRGLRPEKKGKGLATEYAQRVEIPGVYSRFSVDNASLINVRNEEYELEQILNVEFGADVRFEDLKDKVKVWILPKDRPQEPGIRKRSNYNWSSTSNVSQKVLRLATEVAVEHLPIEEDFARVHSYRYKVNPKQYLYIQVAKNVESLGGYKLKKAYDRIRRVPSFSKELRILNDGAILSMSGEHKLSILSHQLEAVRFTAARVLPAQVQHLISQTGGNFKSPYFHNYNFSQENISAISQSTQLLEKLTPGKMQYFSYDFSKHLTVPGSSQKKYGLFLFKVEGWNPRNRYTTGPSDKRLVLITDLGVVVKKERSGKRNVFVQSIHSGNPVGSATVKVLAKNGTVLLSRTTDYRGHCMIPNLNDFNKEQKPVAFLVTRGTDFSFLSLGRHDRRLNFSRFNVGGIHGGTRPEKLRAYVFSSRGIYRPGDRIEAGLIIKAGDWSRNLLGTPLEFSIKDPRGNEVLKKRVRATATGLHEVKMQTKSTSPTGDYTINVYVIRNNRYRGSLLGSTKVQLEEFIPDRMKIRAEFSKPNLRGWVHSKDLKAMVELKNLYGVAAVNRRITGRLMLYPGNIYFPGYDDYQFFDPIRAERGFQDRLEEQHTDGEGRVTFDLKLEKYANATYRLAFQTQGYEAESGRSVGAETSILISPLNYLVGYKANGRLNYINKGSSRKVSLVALNSDVKKVEVKQVKARLNEIRHVSVLMRQPNGTYKYQSVPKIREVKKWDWSIPAKGLNYTLPTNEPGEFKLILSNSDNKELCTIPFTVIGKGNLDAKLDKNAELRIRLDKSDYNPGEAIRVNIQAPYTGSGLITIERDEVYAYKWFTTSTTSSVQTITVPADMEGNGYVNVAFIRNANSEEIYMSPLSYGVEPFSIARDNRKNPITLNVPKKIQPGKKLTIKYETKYAGDIIIFAVDEGILQVAGYKTPDPLKYFFRKQALEVRTDQILDQILPEFALVKRLSAMGGGDMPDELGENLNPFKRKQKKPAVFWSGVLKATGGKQSVTYTVPAHFNGTLRVMAVSVAKETIGVAKTSVLSQDYFILSPHVPTFVAPNDVFISSVTIANNLEGSGKNAMVKVQLELDKQLKSAGKLEQVVTIAEGSEKTVDFKLTVAPEPGAAELVFKASSGDKISRYPESLSVRPLVPYRTELQSGILKKGSKELAIKRKMFKAFRQLEVSASTLPLGLAKGLIEYLKEYPYLCTEQAVSRGFAALGLYTVPEFGYAPKEVKAILDKTIVLLRARQTREGGWPVWSHHSESAIFHTIYAMHFLTEARDSGYPVPKDLMKKGMKMLSRYAKNSGADDFDIRMQAYAAYVLTRNNQIRTNTVNSILVRLKKSSKDWSKDVSGIYLAATYQMLKMEAEAAKLLKQTKVTTKGKFAFIRFYDPMIRNSQALYLIAKHFPDQLSVFSGEGIASLAKGIEKNQFNTVSSAYTVLAFTAMAEVLNKAAMQVEILEVYADKQTKPLILPQKIIAAVPYTDKATALQIKNSDLNPVYYQVMGKGFDNALPQKAVNNGIEIYREFRNEKGTTITQADLGEEVDVYIRLRSTSSKTHYDLAVVDLLPGGFEPVLGASRGGSRQGQHYDSGSESFLPIRTMGSSWKPTSADIREDRVVLHGSIGQDAKEFVYRIRAVNTGTYQLPPPYMESMYERSIWSVGKGGTFKIKKRK